ncbi:tRNA (adenine-N(1))-methyltransferase [Deinococcus piscis]|uniref:tRNA (Adenine-N(1))-methyltransferase n=1 Tax=Deinococcus piscis TaxID=394230 RepID=A0ABQ3JXX1_9DEIO|nr:tRNA (adenine(22)-N(1))-methyltransferase TrmK [Deinococcus piscis]GHF95069.1 tRNA (adenine-N(1))-methyltransferase [Deinococcus piscis]
MTFQPRLDARLEMVLSLIRAEVHADIGTDHAGLPIRLVQTGRVRRCIGVELNAAPLELAHRQVARAGLGGQIELRQGDGLAPLGPGEVDSVSMTGLGAGTIAGVLERGRQGGQLPGRAVVQCNDSPLALRSWAREAGYWLEAETLVDGYWPYPVLAFTRAAGPDPAYDDLPLDAALRFGPQLLREHHPLLRRVLADAYGRYAPAAAPGRSAQRELDAVLEALAYLGWTVADLSSAEQ